MENIINISDKTTPKLNVITANDTGSLKLRSPSSSMKSPSSLKSPSLKSPSLKSVNFGPGLELLMNPKKTISPKSDMSISDLKSLDNEVNKLTKKSAMESILNKPAQGIKLKISELPDKKVSFNIGKTNQDPKKDTTWDGFKKFNNIPVNPEANSQPKIRLSTEEETRQKLFYLRKLNLLQKRGIKLTKTYSMEDSLTAIKAEYEMLKKDREKQNSVKFQGKMLMAFVSGLEFLNDKFDPFDLKLDGWAEAVNENIEEYDDVFAELHEKYGEKTKMAPELKLLFMVGGSAAMLHMTNTMFKSAMPGMDDIMRQNPELMSQFTQAAANSMSRENPGFGGFMQNVMGGPRGAPPGPSDEMRRNPPKYNDARPMERPDIGGSRRIPNDEQDPFKKDRKKRREMKGPSDLDNILSGLKTKKINIKDDAKSIASIEEIKELTKKSKKKKDKNIVALNI